MKTSNRVRKNGSTSRIVSQAQPPAPSPAGSGPAYCIALHALADPVRNALDELERAAKPVAALCVMNGWLLGEKIHWIQAQNDKDGFWEKFSELEFHGGMAGVSLEIVKQFKQDLVDWREDQLAMIGGTVPQRASSCDLERSVAAVVFLILTQSDILSSHYASSGDDGCGAMECASPVLDRLDAAWEQSNNLRIKMNQIIESSTATGNAEAAKNSGPFGQLSRQTIIAELKDMIAGLESANSEPADGKVHDIDILKPIAALKAGIEIVKSN